MCETTRLAKLDRAFERDAARWPGLHAALLDRLDARMTGLALQLALAQLPRLELRLLCLFWHLADRWGRVDAHGVVVSLRISQATLADLVSARRPSVSHALAGLREQGTLVREAPGRWLLRGAPPREWAALVAPHCRAPDTAVSTRCVGACHERGRRALLLTGAARGARRHP